MVRQPDVFGDTIVFCAEGDLWLGSISGKTAQRLTRHEGNESNPRFSPDGKIIAFTGQYDGVSDVYVIPTVGGDPKRLTFDPGGASVVEFNPDGKSVLFRSDRHNRGFPPKLYTISVTGGIPKALALQVGAQGSYSPDGTKLAFVRLPMEDHRWKQYRGGQANGIRILDLKTNKVTKVGNVPVQEMYPAWTQNGLYFVSEREGSANLYQWDAGVAKKVTNHKGLDVTSAASDGVQVVYQIGDALWVYNTKTKRGAELTLALETDSIHARIHSVPGTLEQFTLGPTGKRILVASRGQLFNVPVEKGEIRNVAQKSETRTYNFAWSPNGKQIAFVSDRNGEQNIWLQPQSGGEATMITNFKGMPLSELMWSPDSKKIAFLNFAQQMQIVDVVAKSVVKLGESPFNGISGMSFSPDSKYLAYARSNGWNSSQIIIQKTDGKDPVQVGNGFTVDSNPVFDPEGKYLYFVSERNFKPEWDRIDFQMNLSDTSKIYAYALRKDVASAAKIDPDEEPVVEGIPKPDPNKKTEPLKKEAGEESPEEAEKSFSIDFDGLSSRYFLVDGKVGNVSSMGAAAGKLVYLSESTLKMYSAESGESADIADGIQDFVLSADGKKIAILGAGRLKVTDLLGPIAPAVPAVNLSAWKVTVNPRAEWKQMFYDAWRTQRDVFYDPAIHGQNWENLKKRYEALLPAVATRAELNELLGELWAEVNASHQFVGGGYSRLKNPQPSIASLGADLTWDVVAGAFRITNIMPGDGFEDDARSPLLAPGLNVREGDFLLEIDGMKLDDKIEPNSYFVGKAGATMALKVGSKANGEGSRIVRIKPMASDTYSRYLKWVADNRAYVTKNGGKTLAYIHIPDMGSDGFKEFSKHFYANLDKDGIILDARFNGGGIINGMILERLKRVIYEYDQSRYGAPQPYHRTGFNGRVVVMSNEMTGSDGEYFCTGFRYMKLGATVGTRTWGGYMAVAGRTLLDGGFVAVPVQGSFYPTGEWLADGIGFTPDYVVEEDHDAYQLGKDVQLDKAIDVLKDLIRKNPPKWPTRQLPPSKTKGLGNSGG